jgi:hypothetical protein
MTTVFWDRKGVTVVEFMQQGTTVTSAVYCKTLKNCVRPTIQNKRRGMLTYGVLLIHANACPHTGARTRALLDDFNWALFDHRPHTPGLALSDYHMITYLKN